jgi:predicted enzyme related to lactoylglutathione lyase
MESEVRFYRDVLGLCIRYPRELSDYTNEMWVAFDIGNTILALHGGAESKPDGLHEIVFGVENIEEARSAIIEKGYDIGEIHPLEDGAPIAQGLDPAGHRYAIRSDR